MGRLKPAGCPSHAGVQRPPTFWDPYLGVLGREGRASSPLAHFRPGQWGCWLGAGRSLAEALQVDPEGGGHLHVTVGEPGFKGALQAGRGQKVRATRWVIHPPSNPLLVSPQQFTEPRSCGSDCCPWGMLAQELFTCPPPKEILYSFQEACLSPHLGGFLEGAGLWAPA